LFSGFLERMMSFILIWTCIFIISREKESKILATLIFILAGFLGIASLNMNISQSLLPLLTGLFGSSTLIISILQKTKIPEQKIEKISIDYKKAIKPLAISSIISPIFSFLPGLGSSEAAVISSSLPFYKKLTRKQFLVLLGSINTVVMFASFTTLYIINKARSGAAKAVQDLMNISFSTLIYIIMAMVLASIFAVFITIFLSKFFSKHIHKFNYSKLSLFILIFLIAVIIIFTGAEGFLLFVISTILGLTCHFLGVRKSFLMGSLLIPTILLYLPF
jgi:putative membrane protein